MRRLVSVIMLLMFTQPGPVRAQPVAEKPEARVYAVHGDEELRAYVFAPRGGGADQRHAAVVVLHGGGWSTGEVSWAFPRARYYAERGMVGVAVQYRLSGRPAVTPLDAIDDVCAAISWVRRNADSLAVDPDRIVAYGWSAGAHLALGAVLFDADPDRVPRAAPDALILVSPAVSLQKDAWFRQLLGDRAAVDDVSPDEHVRPGMPPTLILQGSDDTVTPLAGSQRFCDRMNAAGNSCTLHVYEGYGHLFTPRGIPDDGIPQPDPEVSKDARRRGDDFLKSLGFME